ncbi:MAG TPA: polymer-forming cytoskeletal protein [Burkholderiaceae bacterium]|nr:polymer-forming cytoskeletal protein [Burkholderiaceae bacterium]
MAEEISKQQDKLDIDPLGMNIVNRIAPDSKINGEVSYNGGLLVQGDLSGSGQITGRLIIWHGSQIRGHFRVLGDLYVFGRVGSVGESASETVIECYGTAFIASTASTTGTIVAQRLRLYEGADLQGPFKTIKNMHALPELDQTA